VRYAVLSDIHGNLEALEAVLADAEARADAALCLGDVVGYGADPEACIERTAGRAAVIVAGNHEHGVAGLLDLDWFNDYARVAVEWTRDRLDEDHRRYLAALPLVAEVGDATLVLARAPGGVGLPRLAAGRVRGIPGVRDPPLLRRPLAPAGGLVARLLRARVPAGRGRALPRGGAPLHRECGQRRPAA